MKIETLIGDSYNIRARLQPVLLILIPIIFILILLSAELHSLGITIFSVMVFCGVTTWLMQIGRDRGKRMEKVLFRLWGGKPSVTMLRHRNLHLAKETKHRYRAFLEKNVPELRLATPEEEQKYPDRADHGYENATSWLLAKTRDRNQFHMIFEENMNYGFRRNLWALKPTAIITDISIFVSATIYTIVPWIAGEAIEWQTLNEELLPGILITIVHILAFIFIVNQEWVRMAAEEYAKQLLAACDTLINHH